MEYGPPKYTFSYFDHEADMGIRGEGATLAQAFISAATAVFAMMCDLSLINTSQRIDIEFEESDREIALVTWLNQLIGQARSHGLMFAKFTLTHENNLWHGSAWGEPWRNDMTHGIEVKGATLTQLQVKQLNNHWIAQCVVDV